MKTKLVTAPSQKPLSDVELKTYLRITEDEFFNDEMLKTFLGSAVARVEDETGRALINQTWDLIFDSWEELIWADRSAGILRVMPFGVCQSVVSVSYLDENEDTHTVSSDQYKISGLGTEATRIVFHADGDFEYPDLYEVDPITVRIICGYGDTQASVPDQIKTALMVIVSDQYDDEDHFHTINALLKPYVLWSF